MKNQESRINKSQLITFREKRNNPIHTSHKKYRGHSLNEKIFYFHLSLSIDYVLKHKITQIL